ncbi:reverse transcriptase domain-containing protein [Tanacetum coccineum]
MKKFVKTLPTLTAPIHGEVLMIYLAASIESISAALFTRREEGQVPIYFVSRVLQGAELNYPALEKLILVLVHAVRRLRRYFQAHTVAILTNSPIKLALMKPEKSGHVAKWAIDLGEHDIVFRARGVGLMVIEPKGKEYTYALRFEFETTNNEEEYEALLAGLRIAQEMEIIYLEIFVDSQLLVNQIKGIYAAKQPAIREYLQRTKETLRRFRSYTIEHIRRNQNKKVDALSKLALMTFEHLTKEVLVKFLARRLIEEKEVLQVETKEEES